MEQDEWFCQAVMAKILQHDILHKTRLEVSQCVHQQQMDLVAVYQLNHGSEKNPIFFAEF